MGDTLISKQRTNCVQTKFNFYWHLQSSHEYVDTTSSCILKQQNLRFSNHKNMNTGNFFVNIQRMQWSGKDSDFHTTDFFVISKSSRMT